MYKQQLAGQLRGRNERRYFKGVQGVKGAEGDIFGAINLFKFRRSDHESHFNTAFTQSPSSSPSKTSPSSSSLPSKMKKNKKKTKKQDEITFVKALIERTEKKEAAYQRQSHNNNNNNARLNPLALVMNEMDQKQGSSLIDIEDDEISTSGSDSEKKQKEGEEQSHDDIVDDNDDDEGEGGRSDVKGRDGDDDLMGISGVVYCHNNREVLVESKVGERDVVNSLPMSVSRSFF